MSSLTTAQKSRVPSAAYLVSDGEPEPKEEKPVEKPGEDGPTATWKPGGFIPTRARWHSVRGRIQRFLA